MQVTHALKFLWFRYIHFADPYMHCKFPLRSREQSLPFFIFCPCFGHDGSEIAPRFPTRVTWGGKRVYYPSLLWHQRKGKGLTNFDREQRSFSRSRVLIRIRNHPQAPRGIPIAIIVDKLKSVLWLLVQDKSLVDKCSLYKFILEIFRFEWR